MAIPLKVLLLEDKSADAEAILGKLRQDGFDSVCTRAETESDFLARLDASIDIILADYALPQLPASRALQLRDEQHVDIPLILLSDNGNEQVLCEAIKLGAADYVLKDRLERLGLVVNQALQNKQLREEKKQAEIKWHESEERLRSIVEQISDMIAILNIDSSVRYATPSLSNVTGYSIEELLGKPILDLIHPEDLPAEISALTHRAQHPGAAEQPMELRVRHKDGTYRILEVIGNNLMSNQAIDGIVVNARDITNRKQSQHALAASQEFARNIIESSIDMIIAVDQNRNITEFNRAAEETFGYRREEILGKNISILYADPPVGAAIHKMTVTRGRSLQELYNRRKNGEIFPSLLAASVLTDSHGQVIGLMGISRDITELKQSEQELKLRADEFSALYEITRDLAAQHDLPSLLETIVERAANLLHVPGVGVYLYDSERGDLHFQAVKDSRNPPAGTRVALGEGMAGHVAQTRRPMIVDDYRTTQIHLSTFKNLPITAVVEVPMLYSGELLGVLVVNQIKTSCIQVSIGVASFPEVAQTRAGLIEQADRACYRAKALGGGVVSSTSVASEEESALGHSTRLQLIK